MIVFETNFKFLFEFSENNKLFIERKIYLIKILNNIIKEN
jgi:hypothetical protein